MVFLVISITAFGIWSWLKTETGQQVRDQMQLRIWGVGEIVRQYATSRFCRVLGTMLQNGVPILTSLEVSRHVTGNRMMSQAIRSASDSIASGQSLAQPLQRSGQFSDELIELVRVGKARTVSTKSFRTLQKLWSVRPIAHLTSTSACWSQSCCW